MRVIHLKRASGSKTACGLSHANTPMSTNWEGFKLAHNRCARCDVSPQAIFNRKPK